MDARSLARFFDNCGTMVCAGRKFPLQLAYLVKPSWNYVDRCAQIVRSLHANEPIEAGDVLVFLPTREDCEEFVRTFADSSPTMLCVPLHEGMSMRDQQVATTAKFTSKRKVIVSTDIAETSLTIANISFVVDSMYARYAVFDASTGLISLETRAISKAKADQRSGRAGRIPPGGKSIRLCTEHDFRSLLPRHEDPQILRSDLVSSIWGCCNISHLKL